MLQQTTKVINSSLVINHCFLLICLGSLVKHQVLGQTFPCLFSNKGVVFFYCNLQEQRRIVMACAEVKREEKSWRWRGGFVFGQNLDNVRLLRWTYAEQLKLERKRKIEINIFRGQGSDFLREEGGVCQGQVNFSI